MDPAPPLLLKCPHCDALYTQEAWLSGNNFGATLWSDGVMTDGMMGTDHDPVVLCQVCRKLFATNKAYFQNIWGFRLPKDKTFHRTGYISLEDAIQLLNDQELLFDLGEGSFLFSETVPPNLSEEAKRQQAFNHGQYRVRHMIWRKLNDKIRETGYRRLTPEMHALVYENAKALLPLLPEDEYEQTLLVWRAELHRNVGEFGKSLKTLSKITERPLLKTKRKMIFLNLMRNRKLVRLWADSGDYTNKLRLWWSWVW
jgi:hypothetical protein